MNALKNKVYIGGSQDGTTVDNRSDYGGHEMFAYFQLPNGWVVEHYFEDGVDSDGRFRYVMRQVVGNDINEEKEVLGDG
jgi:hypothetical protein